MPVVRVGGEHLTLVALTLNPSPTPPRSPLQGDGSGGFAVLFDGEGL
jgi:hypothetical protein